MKNIFNDYLSIDTNTEYKELITKHSITYIRKSRIWHIPRKVAKELWWELQIRYDTSGYKRIEKK